VLEVDYDDGREETFAFVPGRTDTPVRTDFRMADPFLVTWYQIGAGEPPPAARMLADYEVLGFQPERSAGEDAWRITLRSIVPRGYDRSEVVIARADYAVLEQRHYLGSSRAPALVAVAPRAAMTRFGDHMLPERIRYEDRIENRTIDVQIRYMPLAEGSDAQFFPATFHRTPVPGSELPPQDPAPR